VTALGVLADDLTGALGSAARLKAGGLEPVLVWRPGDLPEGFRPRAVVVDMRTRDAPHGPRATAAEWAARLRELGCERYEQRIDSTLRGHPAEELCGLLDGAGLGDAPVVAVPAWPDAGRVCVGGVQRGASREIDVAETLFGGPAAVVRPDGLAAALLGGATRVVVDGETDADLLDAARAVDALDGAVVTASPGGWLQYHPLAAHADTGFVLVVLGSNTALNHRQARALAEAREVVTAGEIAVATPGDGARPRPGGLASGDWEALAAGGGTVVLSTIAGADPDDVARDPVLADRAADAAAALLGAAHERGLRCRGVVASGGHMASRLVDAVGAHWLAVDREVAPLCPRGTVAGGAWSGLALITKGGLVGAEDTLRILVDDLWKD
jgi:D-threonate/D-erythronate kinase